MTDPTLPSPTPAGDEAPVSDRYRSHTPSDPAEIRRKLLFGVALILALASMYAGLLQWGRLAQYGLAGLALLVVLIALVSGAAGPPPATGSDPAEQPGPEPRA